MTEISRRWKALTDAERAAFNDDAQRVNERFMRLTIDTGEFYLLALSVNLVSHCWLCVIIGSLSVCLCTLFYFFTVCQMAETLFI